MKKRILSLLLVLLMVVSLVPTAALAEDDVVAYGVTGGNIYFNKSTGEITGCDSEVTEANIPSEIDGATVTSIGDWAFIACNSLTSIDIPYSVKYIGDDIFSGGYSLTYINVSEDNTAYCSVDGILFNKDKTKLIKYPAKKIDTSYTIPNSVTSIGYAAFSHCMSLTSVTIPDSVTDIDAIAFAGCTNLTGITIPYNVTSIVGVFEGCTSLTSITLPSRLTYIGGSAFYDCTSLTSITIPDGVTSIGWWAFRNCTGLTSIKIPDSVTNIDQQAFQDCVNLTDITISDGVTYIGDWAFNGCTGLTSITIPRSVMSIGYDPFCCCTDLTSIDVVNENTVYSSVDGVLFNKDITELIRYPAGKTDTSYTIPDSVTSIGYEAFHGCTNLTSVTIPNSVARIDNGAFVDCANLKGITLPDKVTSIGGQAFWDCSNLTDVYYTGTEEQWSAIEIADGNDDILNATIHYNYHEHVTELRNTVEPTCTEAGYTGDEVCTVCGETISQGETIEATGHHFKGKTCTDCGATRSTADVIRSWFQDVKTFFDKLFGRI